MKPYLVVDEGVMKEHNYERLVKIWAHPGLIDALLPKLNSDEDFFAISSIHCQNRVYLEVLLHPLADDNDVAAVSKCVSASWDKMDEDLLDIEPAANGDWVDYKDLADTMVDPDALAGMGKLFRPKTREQKRLLMTLLFDAARNLYDIGSSDLRDEFVEQEPEVDSEPQETASEAE